MTDLTVAKTILQQLGGGQFILMTGAKFFVGGADSLGFKIGGNAKKITHVHIKLTAMDDYTMEFCTVRNFEVVKKNVVEGVYCDNIKDVFEHHTGLYVTLASRRA